MPNVGIKEFDKTFGGLAYVAYDCSVAAAARLLLTISQKFYSEHNYSSINFCPPSIRVDEVFKQLKLSNRSPSFMEMNLSHEQYLTQYRPSNPLSPNGTVKRFEEEIESANKRNKPSGVGFFGALFPIKYEKDFLYEMYCLYQKWGLYMAIFHRLNPAEKVPPYFIDSQYVSRAYHFWETQTNAGIRYWISCHRSGNGMVSIPFKEEIVINQSTGLFQTQDPLAADISTMTLEQVSGALYDLRSYEEQSKNPERTKLLMSRWKELTGTARPSYMGGKV